MSSTSHDSLSLAYAQGFDAPSASSSSALPASMRSAQAHAQQRQQQQAQQHSAHYSGSSSGTARGAQGGSGPPSEQWHAPSAAYQSTSAANSPDLNPQRRRGPTADGVMMGHAHQQMRQPQPQMYRQGGNGAPMYQQSNTSAPAIDHGGRASRGPPLADDLGVPFEKLSVGQQPTRTMTPLGGGEAERANMRYAQHEIYQSAREVDAANSLAAISQEVDAAAAELHGNGNGDRRPSAGSVSSGYAPQQSYEYAMAQHGGAPPQHGGWQGEGYGQEQQGVYYPPEEAYYGGGAGSAPFNPTTHHQSGGAYFGGASGGGSGGGGGYAQSQQGSYDQGSYYGGGGGGYDYGAQVGYPGFPPQQAHGGHPELMRAPSSASHMSMGMGGGLQPGMGSLVRQHTHLSMASVVSGGSSAAVNARRKSKEAEAQRQTLPFNKAFVEEYRQRMKGDPDAEAQFAFAKYLIEAAKKVQDPKDGPKQARKYRDNLLGESLKLIKRLATTGMGLGKPPYSEAQFFLANCFGNGSLGLQVDHEKAYNLYVQASKQNHPAATYRTAVCNEVGAGTRRDHHRAVLFYRKASALGDTAGMYKLGMILLNGLLGQPRNVREAIVWLKRAAGQADEENPHALHELALLHEKPGGSSVVLQDEAYARELFTQAAQLGYAPAQFKLGSAYEYGALTCPVDPRRSIAWYTKAAGKNDGESELALSGWYLTGSEGVLKQSDSEAYLWARRAATKGIPKAEYAVGYYSEVGIGVKADLEEAKRWYMRAAAQGNKRAMQRLTELKKMGGKAGKRGARPTRNEAASECSVM